MITTIEQLACIVLLALGNAGLILYVRDIMDEGMILGWWLPFWAKRLLMPEPDLQRALGDAPDRSTQRAVLLAFAAERAPLIKPLGLCVLCTAPYISASTFAAIWLLGGIELPVVVAALYYFVFTITALRLLMRWG